MKQYIKTQVTNLAFWSNNITRLLSQSAVYLNECIVVLIECIVEIHIENQNLWTLINTQSNLIAAYKIQLDSISTLADRQPKIPESSTFSGF